MKFRLPTLSNVLHQLDAGEKIVEVKSDNLKADHGAFYKSLKARDLNEEISIAEDKSKGTIIFKKD